MCLFGQRPRGTEVAAFGLVSRKGNIRNCNPRRVQAGESGRYARTRPGETMGFSPGLSGKAKAAVPVFPSPLVTPQTCLADADQASRPMRSPPPALTEEGESKGSLLRESISGGAVFHRQGRRGGCSACRARTIILRRVQSGESGRYDRALREGQGRRTRSSFPAAKEGSWEASVSPVTRRAAAGSGETEAGKEPIRARTVISGRRWPSSPGGTTGLGPERPRASAPGSPGRPRLPTRFVPRA